MSIMSPQKLTKDNKVVELVGGCETKILALERDFKEILSDKMKAGGLFKMMPGDLQISLIQQTDKLENFNNVWGEGHEHHALHPEGEEEDKKLWNPCASTYRLCRSTVLQAPAPNQAHGWFLLA